MSPTGVWGCIWVAATACSLPAAFPGWKEGQFGIAQKGPSGAGRRARGSWAEADKAQNARKLSKISWKLAEARALFAVAAIGRNPHRGRGADMSGGQTYAFKPAEPERPTPKRLAHPENRGVVH